MFTMDASMVAKGFNCAKQAASVVKQLKELRKCINGEGKVVEEGKELIDRMRTDLKIISNAFNNNKDGVNEEFQEEFKKFFEKLEADIEDIKKIVGDNDWTSFNDWSNKAAKFFFQENHLKKLQKISSHLESKKSTLNLVVSIKKPKELKVDEDHEPLVVLKRLLNLFREGRGVHDSQKTRNFYRYNQVLRPLGLELQYLLQQEQEEDIHLHKLFEEDRILDDSETQVKLEKIIEEIEEKPLAQNSTAERIANFEANEYAITPIGQAAFDGDMDTIEALIKDGANVNKPNRNGETPVYLAAQNGHAEAIIALKEAGANVNTPNNRGVTPVWIAACNGYAETIKILEAARANVNTAKERDGSTPVYVAAQNGHVEVVAALLEAGADASTKPSWLWGTPLQCAKRGKKPEHKEIAELLEAHFTQHLSGINTEEVVFHTTFSSQAEQKLPSMLTQFNHSAKPILKARSKTSKPKAEQSRGRQPQNFFSG